MTTQELNDRDGRLIANIESVLRVHRQLCEYAAALQVSVENATIVLRGELPNSDLKAELVPAVRQAGVLYRIDDYVRVSNGN